MANFLDIDLTKRYEKQKIALRYWCIGRGYSNAVMALEFAAGYHRGTRKDNVTPEFSHPVMVACLVRTLASGLLYPEETIAAALLHDVREDYDVSDTEIRELFGGRVADAVDAMTKEYRGVKRDPQMVFDAIAADPCASIVKPMDRISNQSTMVGVFNQAKITEYIGETRRYFFPMLKTARRGYPAQEAQYENTKLILETQVQTLAVLIGQGV